MLNWLLLADFLKYLREVQVLELKPYRDKHLVQVFKLQAYIEKHNSFTHLLMFCCVAPETQWKGFQLLLGFWWHRAKETNIMAARTDS